MVSQVEATLAVAAELKRIADALDWFKAYVERDRGRREAAMQRIRY